MTFELVKDYSGLEYYGDIPETPSEPDERVEVFQLEEEDWDILNDGFIDPINSLCNTVLDYGDVDFFDSDKCLLMRTWLIEKLKQNLTEREKCLYSVLLDFSERAIRLETGIVIEL